LRHALSDVAFAASAAWNTLRAGNLFRSTQSWRTAWAKARWLLLGYRGIKEVELPFEGMRLIARTADHAVGCQVFIDGHFGRAEFQRALALLQAAGLLGVLRPTFIDVGANIGTHSLYALKSGQFGRVISVEPEAVNFDLLRRNLRLNGFTADNALNAALSDVAGSGLLALSARNFGDHRVLRAPEAATQRPQVGIELIDFTSLSARMHLDTQAAVIFWIDTQGHEYEVLAGIPRERLRISPFVIEYWPAQLARNGTLERLHGLLGSLGHRVTVLQDGTRLASTAEVVALGDALLLKRPGADYVDLLCMPSGDNPS
jgi:FkbM family methyltransferase